MDPRLPPFWIGAVNFQPGSGERTLDVYVLETEVLLTRGRLSAFGVNRRERLEELRPERAEALGYLLLAASAAARAARASRPPLFRDLDFDGDRLFDADLDTGPAVHRYLATIRKCVRDREAEERARPPRRK